jgi:hypothetical protein
VIVQIEPDLCPGFDQLAGALGKDIAVLADRVFIQEALIIRRPICVATAEDFILGNILNEIREEMMDDTSGARPRPGFDRL